VLKREPNFNASTEENKDEEKGSNESNCKNDLEANKPPTTTQAWTWNVSLVHHPNWYEYFVLFFASSASFVFK